MTAPSASVSNRSEESVEIRIPTRDVDTSLRVLNAILSIGEGNSVNEICIKATCDLLEQLKVSLPAVNSQGPNQ